MIADLEAEYATLHVLRRTRVTPIDSVLLYHRASGQTELIMSYIPGIRLSESLIGHPEYSNRFAQVQDAVQSSVDRIHRRH